MLEAWGVVAAWLMTWLRFEAHDLVCNGNRCCCCCGEEVVEGNSGIALSYGCFMVGGTGTVLTIGAVTVRWVAVGEVGGWWNARENKM